MVQSLNVALVFLHYAHLISELTKKETIEEHKYEFISSFWESQVL